MDVEVVEEEEETVDVEAVEEEEAVVEDVVERTTPLKVFEINEIIWLIRTLGWVPVTKLGRLVSEKLIKRLEEIYLYALPVKEAQIIDWFLGTKLKDEVMKIMPVQKQTTAGTFLFISTNKFQIFVFINTEIYITIR